MKAKRFWTVLLAVAFTLLALVSLMTVTALADTLHKINEIELEITAPVAGDSVNLSYASVTLGHPDYKVVGLSWYKDQDTTIDDRLGIGNNESMFVGGHSYTVKIDLALKNTSLTEWDKVEGADKYQNITATVNGQTATIEDCYPSHNWDRLCVVYKFADIPIGKVKTPCLFIDTPVAGELQPMNLTTGYEEKMYVTNSFGYNWYVNDGTANDYGTGWRFMQLNEAYEAGVYYKAVVPIQTQEGFVFDLAEAFTLDGVQYIHGYVNGRQTPFRVENDQRVYVVYDVKCKAQIVDSVSIRDVLAPAAGQHPNYNMVVDTDNQYAFTADEANVGKDGEYGYFNGFQWREGTNILTAESVFEAGKIYTLSFFIEAASDYEFADWLEAEVNVGHISVVSIPGNPKIAFVEITFAPCGGGVMHEIHLGGIVPPVTGATPDFTVSAGQGFEVLGKLVWYDIIDEETAVELDEDSKFVYGHTYGVMIDLRAIDEYSFAPHDELKVYIDGKEVDHIDRYAGESESEYVTVGALYTCGKAMIAEEEITVSVPLEGSPLPNQAEVKNGTVKIDGMIWTDESGVAFAKDYTVQPGKLHNFVILLFPAEGYFFDTEHTNIVINGQWAGLMGGEDSIMASVSMFPDELPIFSVSFDINGADGTMDSVVVKQGKYTLPDFTATPPAGMRFSHWETSDGTKYFGEIEVTENLDLIAVYVEGEAEHVHVFGDAFNANDGTFHWKECLYGAECPDIVSGVSEQSMHIYDNDCDAFCNDCGYERNTDNAGNPLHFYEHACSEVCPNCGLTREMDNHTPGTDATCTDPQKCTVCNKVLAEAKGHTPGEEADCGHDQTCTVCGAVITEASGNHTPGAEATCTTSQTCTVCGEELVPAGKHSPGVEWIADENGHHKLCPCGAKVDAGEHADGNGDSLCDVCGYNTNQGLGAGAIIAIVVGALVLLGGGGFALYWFVFKKKQIPAEE